MPIPESYPLRPVNPYGRSKLMVEEILGDAAAAHGLRYVALRYFNAAGADPDGELGENHQPEMHLIPLVLQAAYRQRPDIIVFGTDHDTPDELSVKRPSSMMIHIPFVFSLSVPNI
jgi:UDP-glucose 4-epimerase